MVLALPVGLVLAIRTLCPCPNVHTTRVKWQQISGHIEQIKCDFSLGFPIEHFKVEPVGVSLRICVHFAKHVIILFIHEVDRVKIT